MTTFKAVIHRTQVGSVIEELDPDHEARYAAAETSGERRAVLMEAAEEAAWAATFDEVDEDIDVHVIEAEVSA